MDDARAEQVLDQLMGWGFVEEDAAGNIVATRRWVAKLQAAAERLNQFAAEHGANPEGNPIVLAVQQALAREELTQDEALFADAVRVLVTLELTRMTPEKRSQHGFGNVSI